MPKRSHQTDKKTKKSYSKYVSNIKCNKEKLLYLKTKINDINASQGFSQQNMKKLIGSGDNDLELEFNNGIQFIEKILNKSTYKYIIIFSKHINDDKWTLDKCYDKKQLLKTLSKMNDNSNKTYPIRNYFIENYYKIKGISGSDLKDIKIYLTESIDIEISELNINVKDVLQIMRQEKIETYLNKLNSENIEAYSELFDKLDKEKIEDALSVKYNIDNDYIYIIINDYKAYERYALISYIEEDDNILEYIKKNYFEKKKNLIPKIKYIMGLQDIDNKINEILNKLISYEIFSSLFNIKENYYLINNKEQINVLNTLNKSMIDDLFLIYYYLYHKINNSDTSKITLDLVKKYLDKNYLFYVRESDYKGLAYTMFIYLQLLKYAKNKDEFQHVDKLEFLYTEHRSALLNTFHLVNMVKIF